MKNTPAKTVWFVLQLLFFLIVPCVLVWCQYASAEAVTVRYKISVTGIALMLFIFLISKHFWLTPFLKKLESKLAQIEVAQLTATEPEAIESLKRKYRQLSLFQLIIRLVMPILLLLLVLSTIKVVEAGVVKLFGVLSLCAVSFALGVVCRVFEIYAVRLEHEEKKK